MDIVNVYANLILKASAKKECIKRQKYNDKHNTNVFGIRLAAQSKHENETNEHQCEYE